MMPQRMRRELRIDLFCVLFGIGAWIAINGLWAELPLLVAALPEGWNLSSYLILICQVGNIGPIIYSLLKWYKNDVSKEVTIYVLIAFGLLSTVLLIFFWDRTAYVGGKETSLYLFILVFFMSLVDCTSSVLFIPFMAVFPRKYLTSYLIGEGLSGFLPGVVALGQGVGGNPSCVNRTYTNDTDYTYYQLEYVSEEARFSVQVFYIFLVAMVCSSCCGFLLLNVTPVAKRTKIIGKEEVHNNVTKDNPTESLDPQNGEDYEVEGLRTVESQRVAFFLMIVAVTTCLGNGILPSIQTFSCLPYGNRAAHLAVTLSLMANPLACTVGFLFTAKSLRIICGLTILLLVAASYILVTAVLSPVPPLVGTSGGEFLVVLAWVMFVGLLSYIKISIATALHYKENLLFYYGAITQAASAVGALTMFFIVNYTDTFVSYDPCAAGDIVYA